MNIKAQGQLRHCFWGTYQATIALIFQSEAEAKDGQKILGLDWSFGEKNKNALVWHGQNPRLEEILNQLESFGAPKKKVTSIAKSIDFGEPFEVTIPICPEEQMELF